MSNNDHVLMYDFSLISLNPFLSSSSCFLLMPHLDAGTVLARMAVFPVIVKGQREAAKLNNVLPDMTKLTNRLNEAKQSGNKFECKNHCFSI